MTKKRTRYEREFEALRSLLAVMAMLSSQTMTALHATSFGGLAFGSNATARPQTMFSKKFEVNRFNTDRHFLQMYFLLREFW